MENEAEKQQQQPLVLSLIRFPFIPTFEPQFSNKYRSLKAWDVSASSNFFDTMSIEERNIFLTTNPQSLEVESLICVATVPIPLETLNLLPSLRCVLSLSAGVDHIDLIECRRRGIVVCNAGTVYSEDVADFAVGLLIDVLRKISSADRFVRAGLWPIKGEYPLGSRVQIEEKYKVKRAMPVVGSKCPFCDN